MAAFPQSIVGRMTSLSHYTFLVPAALLFGLPDNKSLCQLIVLAFFSFGRLLNEVVKTLSTGCR